MSKYFNLKHSNEMFVCGFARNYGCGGQILKGVFGEESEDGSEYYFKKKNTMQFV